MWKARKRQPVAVSKASKDLNGAAEPKSTPARPQVTSRPAAWAERRTQAVSSLYKVLTTVNMKLLFSKGVAPEVDTKGFAEILEEHSFAANANSMERHVSSINRNAAVLRKVSDHNEYNLRRIVSQFFLTKDPADFEKAVRFDEEGGKG